MTWRRSNNSTGDDRCIPPTRIERRYYDIDSQVWPRLTLTTWRVDGGVTIDASIKDDACEFWRDTGVPVELIDDAVEMLVAAKAKVAK